MVNIKLFLVACSCLMSMVEAEYYLCRDNRDKW